MAAARNEFSAGGVVYKKLGNAIKVVLIARQRSSGGQARKIGTVWCLPKGKIEKKETPQETAAREIEEETGLTGKLIKSLGDITYWFVSPQDKARVFKKVCFFLFEYVKGSLSSHDSEVNDAKWFSPEEALEIMTHPSEKKIMQKAIREILA